MGGISDEWRKEESYEGRDRGTERRRGKGGWRKGKKGRKGRRGWLREQKEGGRVGGGRQRGTEERVPTEFVHPPTSRHKGYAVWCA